MVISKVHALLLDRMVASRKSGGGFVEPHTYEERFFLELETQGLVHRTGHSRLFAPTYLGEELAHLMCKQITNGTIPRLADWRDSWRWIGSDIVGMIEKIRQGQNLASGAVDRLIERGFAVHRTSGLGPWDPVTLTDSGTIVSDIYRALEPGLCISASLADVIRSTPAGPADAVQLATGPHSRALLEGMRLIVYSVPDARWYTYTRLGKAIRSMVTHATPECELEYLSPDILLALVAVMRMHQVAPEMYEHLRKLGYIDDSDKLTVAGHWGMEVYKLWHRATTRETVYGFPTHDKTVVPLHIQTNTETDWLEATLEPTGAWARAN